MEVETMGGSVEVRGALDVERTAGGWSPRRLPDWTRPQIDDLMLAAMVAMSSGVRLALRTDSSWVELDVSLTSFRASHEGPRLHGFDLVVDGEVRNEVTTEGGSRFVIDWVTRGVVGFEEGDAITLRWDGVGGSSGGGLGGSLHDVEIWLPTTATVEVRSLRVADGALVERPADGGRRWIHHGSSISHCMEVTHPTETWPVLAGRAAGVEVTNLGFAGQCQLDPFVARTIRDARPGLVSLELGINVVNADSMKERVFVPALHGFLDTLREGLAGVPILVVSPVFCPIAEDHPGPTVPSVEGPYRVVEGPAELREGSLTLRRIRELIAAVVDGRRARGDVDLHHLDGLTLFGESDWAAGDMPDDLHPTAEGYRRMGERFGEAVFGTDGVFANA